MIKNIILDIGNVVLEKFLNISKEEYKEELIKEYPDNKKEIEKLLEAKYQKEVLPVKQDTIDLMMQLKENYEV